MEVIAFYGLLPIVTFILFFKMLDFRSQRNGLLETAAKLRQESSELEEELRTFKANAPSPKEVAPKATVADAAFSELTKFESWVLMSATMSDKYGSIVKDTKIVINRDKLNLVEAQAKFRQVVNQIVNDPDADVQRVLKPN